MLEKALISGVTHKAAETVYRVEGVSAARLFDALAEAGVNVDTVIQTGSEIVFSADEGPEAVDALGSLGVEWSAREDLGQVSVIGAGMKSHPGVAAKMFSALEELGIQPVIVDAPRRSKSVASSRATRSSRPFRRCMPRSSSSARKRSARMAEPRIGVVGATGAVGQVTLALLGGARARAGARVCSSRSAGTGVLGGSELEVEEATKEALGSGELDLCFFSVGTGPSSELVRRPSRAGPSAWTSRPRSGSRTACRSSCRR